MNPKDLYVVSVQRLLNVALLGLIVVASGCGNDGSATSGSGQVFLPEDNQLPNETQPPRATPGSTPPASQNNTASGQAEVQVVLSGIVIANESFTLTGTQAGNILALRSANINGNATVSGGRFTTSSARFTLNNPRVDCDGTVTVTGTISGNSLTGQISGTPSCSLDSVPAISSILSGQIIR